MRASQVVRAPVSMGEPEKQGSRGRGRARRIGQRFSRASQYGGAPDFEGEPV